MAKSLNLFGDMQEMEPPNEPKSKYQRFKSMNHYQVSDNVESCKSCAHCLKMEYHNKNYYKCELMGVSHSEASDIRLKMVCDKWSKAEL